MEPEFVQMVRHLSDGKYTVYSYLGDLTKSPKQFVKKSIKPSFRTFKHNSYFHKRDNLATECASANKSTKPAENKTVVVQDPLPPGGQTVMVVPIKENAKDVQISDEAFEQAGDKIVDTLDFCNASIYTGKKADEKIAEIKEHSKSTEAPASAIT